MSKINYTKAWLLAGLFFVILSAHLPVLYSLFYHDLTGASVAADGNIDVMGLSTDRSVVLDGQWDFYWHRLIVTEGEREQGPDFQIQVPDYWSKYKVNGNWLPADGFASYHLTLENFNYSRPVTIYIPDFGSAYRVFIDGRLTAESGTVVKDERKVFTVPEAKLYPVTLSAGVEHEVVIETATTRFSGLYMAPVLKDYEKTTEESGGRDNLRFLLLGTVLFSFVVLSTVYRLSYRKGVRSAWLPVMMICVLLRIMLTTEFYSFWQNTVFGGLSYESTNPLMFLVTFVLKFLLIFLAQEQFGVTFSRKEKMGFFLYYAAIYLIYLLVPHEIYNRHLTVLLPLATFALEIYAFFKLYFSRQPMKKFGLPIFGGVILAVSGLIIDCYYINGNIYLNLSSTLLMTLALYLMILSLVYALRIGGLYNDLALSSSRLAMAKSQIAAQGEYYESLSGQINETRAIKHDIRHFIGAMQGLAEDGRYDELKEFLNTYGEKTETDPLPVFCENGVANSILGYYALKAKAADIPFRCVCSIPRQLAVSDIDLCVVLGNALENAIEACCGMESQSGRFIAVEVRPVNRQLLIKVKNTYNGLLQAEERGYPSTKKEPDHGMGLGNIRKVAAACGGFVKTEHDGKVFTLKAAFPNLKDEEK